MTNEENYFKFQATQHPHRVGLVVSTSKNGSNHQKLVSGAIKTLIKYYNASPLKIFQEQKIKVIMDNLKERDYKIDVFYNEKFIECETKFPNNLKIKVFNRMNQKMIVVVQHPFIAVTIDSERGRAIEEFWVINIETEELEYKIKKIGEGWVRTSLDIPTQNDIPLLKNEILIIKQDIEQLKNLGHDDVPKT